MRRHAVPRGFWVPTQHLFLGREKPRNTFVELAGRRTWGYALTCSQWRISKTWTVTGSPHVCSCFIYKNAGTCFTTIFHLDLRSSGMLTQRSLVVTDDSGQLSVPSSRVRRDCLKDECRNYPFRTLQYTYSA